MVANRKVLLLASIILAFGVAVTAFTAIAAPGALATTPPDLDEPCGTVDGLGCAPASERVDLYKPVFSNPTKITNPLLPLSSLKSLVMLGESDGEKLRVEQTLLPETKLIDLDGGKTVEAVVAQYTAYLDGRIHEIALDFYAQDDLGAVWYLGEDVFNYEDGEIADTDGTWLAGRDGPAALIMPAHPQAGDVYRPENAPGLVFEEVTVTETGVTVDGPRGPVAGAIVIDELHMDGTHEDKIFAPGYGEFLAGDEHLALAVPIDALPGATPHRLRTISTQADEMLDAFEDEDWRQASNRLHKITKAWDAFRLGEVPPLLEAQMDQALDDLTSAVEAVDAEDAGQAALAVGQAAQDLQLRHKAPAKVDRARFELWAERLLVDAAAEDAAAVKGDVSTLEWVRDRFARTLRSGDLSRIDNRLARVRAAADAGDLEAAERAAERLLTVLERAR
jgi:hypothetical protein